jgi:hypothetical protein
VKSLVRECLQKEALKAMVVTMFEAWRQISASGFFWFFYSCYPYFMPILKHIAAV